MTRRNSFGRFIPDPHAEPDPLQEAYRAIVAEDHANAVKLFGAEEVADPPPGPGSFDGGARGGGPPAPEGMEGSLRDAVQAAKSGE